MSTAPAWLDNATKAARGFYALPMIRQLTLLIGLSASIALGGAVIMWSQKPNMRPLFSHLDAKDSSDIIDALDQSGIAYKLQAKSGMVLVPSDKVHMARLRLAAAGLPKGHGAGFESFAQGQGLGVSRFMENARYKHALEAELARTISSMDAVRKARVHLALPKQSSFLSDNHKPTASVMLDLLSGRSMKKDQVGAIQQLVASGIPDLDAHHVTVVDQEGRLLSGKMDSDMAITRENFNYKRRLEEFYERHIEDILAPMLGANKVRARVTAKMDFTRSEQTEEQFLPGKRPVVRSEQKLTESSSGGASESGGVPGATANAPGGGGAGSNSSRSMSKERSVKNFEVGKTISHTKNAMGILKKLSVAVVVDDFTAYDAKTKKSTSTPLTKKQLEEITNLVRSAVGFDNARGDVLSVVNSPFAKPEAVEALPEMPIWKQAWVWNIAKNSLGGIFVLLLVFMVIKPVMRFLAERSESEEASGGGSPGHIDLNAPLASFGGADGALPEGKVMVDVADLQKLQHQGQWNQIKQMADEDPKRIAQVMRTWVGD